MQPINAQTAQSTAACLTTQHPEMAAEPGSVKNDPIVLMECLRSHKNISRDDMKAYGGMTLPEIEDAIPGSAEDKSGKQSAARELFIAVAQALSTTGGPYNKLALGVFPFQSEITQYMRETPSLTADAYESAMRDEFLEKHSVVRSWGNPCTTEAEFSITIGDTTQVVLFQCFRGKLIISDGLCYDQSNQIKTLAAAIRKINGCCDPSESDVELLTSYLRRTRALDQLADILDNDDHEAYERTSSCEVSNYYSANRHFTFVSADVDAFGDCEVVGQIAIRDTNRQIIFRNSGDEMYIARVGQAQEANVSALAQVIRNMVTGGNGMSDLDMLMSYLEEESVMDRVRYFARERYRALFEASDEVLKLEDLDGVDLPTYRLVKLGQTHQIQTSSSRGYKTEWYPALNVSAEFAAKVQAEVDVFCSDRALYLISSAIEEANRPKSSLHCPRCGAELVFRTASVLKLGGKPYWGCSNFPTCRHTHLIETSQ